MGTAAKCLSFIVVALAGLTAGAAHEPRPAVKAAPARPDAIACQKPLSTLDLPARVDGFAGPISKPAALGFLSRRFSISTVAGLLGAMETRSEFDALIAPQVLSPESIAVIALEGELECVLPGMSHNARDLLGAAMYRSIYSLSRLDPHREGVVSSLRYYLEKIAIAKGRPFYDASDHILDVPPLGPLTHWIERARVATPALKTCEDSKAATAGASENCLVFPDGSAYSWSRPASGVGGVIETPPTCVKATKQTWDDAGVVLSTESAPSLLRLDIALINPPHDARFDLAISDAYGPAGELVDRDVRAPTQVVFVSVPVPGSYRVRLRAVPVTARVCWREVPAQAIGSGATHADVTVDLPPNEVRYYYFDATCQDIVKAKLEWASGETFYYAAPPKEPGLPGSESGQVTQSSPSWGRTYPAGACVTARPRRYTVVVGHLERPLDVPVCPAQPRCGTLPSFVQVGEAHGSRVKLHFEKQSLLKTFYVGRVTRATWSNDAESVTWEGEMNSYVSTELSDADGNAAKTVGVDYPYFVYREVEDYDKPFSNLPTVSAELPVIAMERQVLDKYQGCVGSWASYEDDSALLHYLNPVSWYRAAAALYSAVGDGIACAFGGGATCVAATCELLAGIGQVGDTLAGNEDDPLGTAGANFAAVNAGDQSTFGLTGGSVRDLSFEGSSKPDSNVWQNIRRIGTACSGVYQAASYLMDLASGSENKDPWARVDYEITQEDTLPAFSQIAVKLDKVGVIDDREGSFQGDGDMYLYSTVATVGDTGAAPAQTNGSGTPLPANKVQGTPFADADVLRVPQSGNRGVGDGETWTLNRTIFTRDYDMTQPNQNVAGLHVQVVMYDEDNFEDDEVGIVSEWFSFGTLWQFVNNCSQGLPGFVRTAANQCEVTRTVRAYTREYQKNGGASGIWGSPGADFTYRVVITPGTWP